MANSYKRLHDDNDPLVKAIEEENEAADRICRKEYEKREVEETLTDVKTAIRHLPKRYFKEATTNTNICLQNTQSGLKTIIGRIKRVKRKQVYEKQRMNRTHKILTAAALILGLAAAAWLAYFLVNSLLDCYNPAIPDKSSAVANP